jgi:hypothetical protein
VVIYQTYVLFLLWTVPNVAVDALILRIWLKRRARRADFELQTEVMSGATLGRSTASSSRRRSLPSPSVVLSVLAAIVVWAVLGLLPGAMEAEAFTSGMTVQSAAATTTDSPDVLTLRLHLDTALPPLWPIAITLDDADARNGYTAVVDFASGPDQTVQVKLAEPLSGGRHTLHYGYAFYISNVSDPYWLQTEDREAAFDVTGSNGTSSPLESRSIGFDPGFLPGFASILLLCYFLRHLYVVRRGGKPLGVDDSVLLSDPPAGLTPAMAVVLMTGRFNSTAFITAMADLASRGYIEVAPGRAQILPPNTSRPSGANLRPLGEAEADLLSAWQQKSGGILGLTDGRALYNRFKATLIQLASSSSWFSRNPADGLNFWTGLGVALAIGGFWLTVVSGQPGNAIDPGLKGSLDMVAIVGFVMAFCAYRWYSNRTQEGGRVLALALAYRNTLRYELLRAANAEQSMASITRRLPWLDTPEAAVAWILALDLRPEALELLRRSQAGPAGSDATQQSGPAEILQQVAWFPEMVAPFTRSMRTEE